MRLIDADALAENFKLLHGYGDYEANMYCAEACYGLGNWVWENPEDYGLEAAEKALKDAPTIEAEPVRHGQWVCGDYYDIGDVCSECDWDSGIVNPTLRYCPDCGAKMDLEG